MDIETALQITDSLVFDKTMHHLTTLQTQIFRGAWFGQTYAEMVASCYCSEPHLKKVGSMLWELLSDIFGEEVRKKTIQAVLERYYYRDNQPHSIPTHQDVVMPIAKTVTTAVGEARLVAPEPLLRSEILPFLEGPVELESPFYIERQPLERKCEQALRIPGAFIQIQGSRQMGKTSYLLRILHKARQEGYQTIALTLQLADSTAFQNLDTFLQWFCASVTRKLQLPLKLDDYWDNVFGSKTNCKDYFEYYLLPQIDSPIVLAIDETDIIFQYPEIAENFFAMLQAWYEFAKMSKSWQNLRIVLVYSKGFHSPSVFTSPPLNVGLIIDLPEFTTEQIEALALQHYQNEPWAEREGNPCENCVDAHSASALCRLPPSVIDALSQIQILVGGQPYLIRIALHHLISGQISLERFLDMAPTETGPYNYHLQKYLSVLEKQPELATALKAILLSPHSAQPNSTEISQLNRMGLINRQNGQLKLRCELYRQFFARQLTA